MSPVALIPPISTTLADTCIRDDVPVYVLRCNGLIPITNPSPTQAYTPLKVSQDKHLPDIS